MSSLCQLVGYLNLFCYSYAENEPIDTPVNKAVREVYPIERGEDERFVIIR